MNTWLYIHYMLPISLEFKLSSTHLLRSFESFFTMSKMTEVLISLFTVFLSPQWEELSSWDLQDNVIRSYQVCNIESDQAQDNWIRSPYINAQ